MGVKVAMLHQGIGGLWNGSDGTESMVNPYINWPFVPDVVNFMEDFHQAGPQFSTSPGQRSSQVLLHDPVTHQGHALKAMQGEIMMPGDPYTIPQKGYNHAWDTHGGGAYLRQHLIGGPRPAP